MLLADLTYPHGSFPPKLRAWVNKDLREFPLKALKGAVLSSSKYCIGAVTGITKGSRAFCGKKINAGYLCKECMLKDAFLPCARCKGNFCLNKNEEARKFCFMGNFSVYLAYFGGKVIKVGVSASQRLKERLVEQGAVAYKVFATDLNGMEARRLEATLAFKYPDRIKTEVKPSLYSTIDLEWFSSQIGEFEIVKENYRLLEDLSFKIPPIKPTLHLPDEEPIAIGQLIIFKGLSVPFSFIRARRVLSARLKRF